MNLLGYNMLGFVFKNSVSKAVLDVHPNQVLKMNGFEEQLKLVRGMINHMQTILSLICTHASMPAMKPLAKNAKTGGLMEIE